MSNLLLLLGKDILYCRQSKKLIAGKTKTVWRFAAANSIDILPFFPNSCGKTREITVAGDQTNPLAGTSVEKGHRVNHQSDVRNILMADIADLRPCDNSVRPKHFGPSVNA